MQAVTSEYHTYNAEGDTLQYLRTLSYNIYLAIISVKLKLLIFYIFKINLCSIYFIYFCVWPL